MTTHNRKKEFLKIIDRYLHHKATLQEVHFLEKYYSYFDKESGITDNLTDSEKEILEKEIWAGIRGKTNSTPRIATLYQSNWVRIAAAASFLILVTVSVLLLRNTRPVNEINYVVKIAKAIHKEKPLYKNDIKPGGNQAILTLADGSTIILDDASKGKLTRQGNTTVIKLDDGRLAYNPNAIEKPVSKKMLFNTLSTPRGGQYNVTLPDGTLVWLNASSSLRFPTEFAGNQRKVEVKGEAYFEVAKNEAMPFIVKAGNEEIKVLGTHFNVSAYTDDKLIKTTLLEGSVKVSLTNSSETDGAGNTITLIPGQQSQLDKDNAITVVEADMQEAIGWKNGFFIFNNEDIGSIMQKITRWYDVKVIYEENNVSSRFTGNISRTSNVSEVLRKLELTETIHFKIEGKTITVLP